MLPRWQEIATSDEATLREWWRAKPTANIGVATEKFGDGAALLVIDVDVKNGKNGLKSITELEEEYGELPETKTVRTPSGGFHVYFLAPHAVKSSVGQLGDGIDIRSSGALVVAEGSSIGGRVYSSENESPIAPAPQWLIDRCGQPRQRKKTESSGVILDGVDHGRALERAVWYLKDADAAVLGQGSNDWTYRVACRVKDEGVTEEECVDLMLEHWNPRCNPPWPPEKLAIRVANAYRYGQEPPGVAAPEVVFRSVLPSADLDNAQMWNFAEIRRAGEQLLRLRADAPTRLQDLIDLWIMFGTIEDSREIDQLIEDAALSQAARVDVAAIADKPDHIHAPKNSRALAELRNRDADLYKRIETRLSGGDAPVVKPRALAKAVKTGALILAAEAAERDALDNGKKLVRYSASTLVETTDEILRIILDDHTQGRERVFSYAGGYVCLRKRTPATVRQLNGGDYPDQPLIFRYSPAAMRERIMRSVLCRIGGREGNSHPGMAPDQIVQTLLARCGADAPPLVGIIEAPTIRDDGSLLDAPGYDARTGLFAWFDTESFEPLVDAPTADDAQAALEYLRGEFLAEFVFESDLDRDVAIAALVTALIRRALPGDAPGFVFSAPQQSSGKTALANAICGAAYGRPSAAVAWPRGDEEMGKTLLALLREGQSGVTFDNVEDGSVVSSAVLAAAITSPTFAARLLHTNDTAEVPCNCVFFITGNNLSVEQDLATRFLICDLNPRTERPDQRAFRRGDLTDWVSRHRADVVRAALTIVRAYFAAESPKPDARPSRFPRWDQMVRYPLIRAGAGDVAVKFDTSHEQDSSLSALRDFLKTWRANFGDQELTASDLLSATSGEMFRDPDDSVKAIGPALLALMTARQRRRVEMKDLNAQAVGRTLKQWARRVAGGLRLTSRRDTHLEINVWAVEIVS